MVTLYNPISQKIRNMRLVSQDMVEWILYVISFPLGVYKFRPKLFEKEFPSLPFIKLKRPVLRFNAYNTSIKKIIKLYKGILLPLFLGVQYPVFSVPRPI